MWSTRIARSPGMTIGSALAEAAFWRAITDSILSHERRVVSVTWPKVNAEAAVLVDHETGPGSGAA